MFELDTILSLFVSSLLIYDASHALRAPEPLAGVQPACAKVVIPSNAAGTATAATTAGGFEPPSTVLICSSSNYLLGARLPSSRPGLYMTIIFFGFMILSVILICAFRFAASRSARRSVLEPLRLAVMALLTVSFLCGVEATILLALPLHTRITLEPFTQSILRACMQTGVTAAAVLEPVLLGMDFARASRTTMLEAEGGVILSDEEPKVSIEVVDEKAGSPEALQQDETKF